MESTPRRRELLLALLIAVSAAMAFVIDQGLESRVQQTVTAREAEALTFRTRP